MPGRTNWRQLALTAVVLAGAVGTLVYRLLPEPANTLTPERLDTLAQANLQEDDLKRCRETPDPVDAVWPKATVADLCRYYMEPVLTRDEARALLDTGRADQLDATFETYLTAHFSDTGRHGILLRAYAEIFSKHDDAVADIVRRWRDARPQSAYALTAEGYMLVSRAGAERGEDTIAATSPEAIATMSATLAEARTVLHAAIHGNRRLLPAYSALMKMARMGSDGALLEQIARQALSIDPTDANIYKRLMIASEPRWGGSEAKMQAVADAAMAHVEKVPMNSLLSTHALNYQAYMHYVQGDARKALALYETALRRQPDPLALKYAADVAMAVGKYAQAVEWQTQALRFFPDDTEILGQRASVLTHLKRLDWALRDATRMAALMPGSSKPLHRKANILKESGDFAGAEQAYQQALAIDPEAGEILNNLAYLYLTSTGHRAKAIAVHDTLVAKFPDHASTWTLQFDIYEREDPARAADGLRRFLQLVDPRDAVMVDQARRAQSMLKTLEERQAQSAPKPG
ncbi:tetratricopeptide repeat protein [Tahibacter amnicola]|uniref:Tetratricopeptide repeat protein n=1 Tax=Tahibacter amnicola TaxID=2976241 RepID=A0ABY6BL05_9GAMM|nr:tetratricopeptide repeat protein [Tahibacter amnicola]UXI69266.1 tetratricopeptide repeat protein [Tahibacter amnicola]